jgi:hypothetical protein
MKVGDKYEVTIAGQKVADATVREVGSGQVVLVVPGTVVTMSTRTEIAPPAPQVVDSSGTEVIIDEVVRQPAQSAPVDETTGGNNAEQQTTTTSEGSPSGEGTPTGPVVDTPNTTVEEVKPVEQASTATE